jgi:hypothetical protein
MHKADRALASARLLLDAGDTDGACNRAEEVRLLADYTGGSVEATDAHEVLSQAKAFVSAVRDYLDRSGDAPRTSA